MAEPKPHISEGLQGYSLYWNQRTKIMKLHGMFIKKQQTIMETEEKKNVFKICVIEMKLRPNELTEET